MILEHAIAPYPFWRYSRAMRDEMRALAGALADAAPGIELTARLGGAKCAR